jgi:hypothetical protein
MQPHHYLLIAIAIVAGYMLAHIWPAPGNAVAAAVGANR